jgi:hypothetical protein
VHESRLLCSLNSGGHDVAYKISSKPDMAFRTGRKLLRFLSAARAIYGRSPFSLLLKVNLEKIRNGMFCSFLKSVCVKHCRNNSYHPNFGQLLSFPMQYKTLKHGRVITTLQEYINSFLKHSHLFLVISNIAKDVRTAVM